ncbi:MAG: glutamyl-tRNA reductase [Chlamydiota bacterium]|nr:glutamyl-tRNA reductase [Chlamydiota bacterium]
MHVGVVGINHKLADLQLREKLAKNCQRRFGPGHSAHTNHAFVLLSTCNRTEIYFSSPHLAETHTYILNILRHDLHNDFDQKLYSYFNEDCFTHLARVTCGIDSAIIFETEIQGQVKIAYQKACEYSTLTSDLHFLFQKCLRIGKKIRNGMPIDRGTPDLEHAIYTTGKHLFKSTHKRKVLFVGASDINMKILHFLRKKDVDDITLCNRTQATAEKLSRKYNLDTLPWQNLPRWDAFDWIIFGTKSPDYLVTKSSVTSSYPTQKLVIDLCVPRNVDPKIRTNQSITLLNIDQINHMLKVRKKGLTKFMESTESIVEVSTGRYLDLFRKKSEFSPKKVIQTA